MSKRLKQYNAADAEEIWTRGIPKSQFHRIARKKDRHRYHRLRQASQAENGRNWRRIAEFSPPPEADEGAAEVAAKLLAFDQQHAKTFKDFDWRLRSWFLKQARSGTLAAAGFVEPRHPDDRPVLVPLDYWTDPICFGDDKVRHGSLKMEAVRILPVNWLSRNGDTATNGAATPPAAKAGFHGRPGRKSRAGEITQAFEELKAAGTLTGTEGISVIAYEVRERIFENDPSIPREGANGLSDETIRRVLRQHKSSE